MSDNKDDEKFELPELPLTEEERKLEEYQKLKDKNRALFCMFCGKPKHDHWVNDLDEDGKIKKDKFGTVTIFRRICPEEIEHNLSYYYDDILKNHVGPRPTTSPLHSLFSVDKILRRGFIAHALIVGSIRQSLPPHLKAFIKFVTQDNNAKKFKYKFLDFTELREIKFGKTQEFSYSSLDEVPVLIFDLEKEAHDNRADENNLLELIVHREARNKALWFVSPTETITNKHLTDQDICKRIYAYKKIDLRSKKDKEAAPVSASASDGVSPSTTMGATGVDKTAMKNNALSFLSQEHDRKAAQTKKGRKA